ncbi:hypothetical protein [Pseudomonas putida]|uniref:hypothetical protein n=1 Tax=Pseudomonas putida TaxID=303 RepID=UPI002DB6A120|nr:hypothetical protein [Pseudomonas putida]WRW04757.1 hypothetical protein VPZ82_04870 [Pseudomonas putida]
MLKPQISPWFHASLIVTENGFETRTMVFIDSVQSLISWMEVEQGDNRMECLQLVSPAWLNGNQNWQMDDLSEVAQCLKGGGIRFTLRDGATLYYPDPAPQREGDYAKLIYRLASRQ